MTTPLGPPPAHPAGTPPLIRARAALEAALVTHECWPCGCLHETLAVVGRACGRRPPAPLSGVLEALWEHLEPRRYDCAGCALCHPAEALAALAEADPAFEESARACGTAPG